MITTPYDLAHAILGSIRKATSEEMRDGQITLALKRDLKVFYEPARRWLRDRVPPLPPRYQGEGLN